MRKAQEDTSICSLNSPTLLTAAKSSLGVENWLCLAEFPAFPPYMLILENKNQKEGDLGEPLVKVCVGAFMCVLKLEFMYEGRTCELYLNPPREDRIKGINFFHYTVFLKQDF